jgi:hypothetical protein
MITHSSQGKEGKGIHARQQGQGKENRRSLEE